MSCSSSGMCVNGLGQVDCSHSAVLDSNLSSVMEKCIWIERCSETRSNARLGLAGLDWTGPW